MNTEIEVIDVPLNEVIVENRFRKDVGNIPALAQSIIKNGLLQPIGITRDKSLVFGHRRLLAHYHIQSDTIPARIVDLDDLQTFRMPGSSRAHATS